jgi:hypothetical protein
LQVTDETTEILKHFGYVFEQRGLVSVKGKGQLMTYYLIGKGGTTPSNPETVFKGEEEAKTNPDSTSGLSEDFSINFEARDNSSNKPVRNNTAERILTLHNPEENLGSTEDSEEQTPNHNLDLSADSKYQLSEDMSPLILGSTPVISGTSETNLLQKSDADD